MDDKYLLFRLVPTMKCNFRCSYCFVPNEEKATKDTMFDLHSPEEWVRAMGNYSDYDVEFYCWGGEPFLLDGTYDIVKGWTAYDHVISGSRIDSNMAFAEKIAERCPTDKLKLNCSWHTQYHTLEQEEAKIRLLNDSGMVGMVNFVASPYNFDVLASRYSMSVDDLIAKFDDMGVFVNVAADFALVENPQTPGYEEYKQFIMKYLCPEDWKQLRCEKSACLCEANKHFFTIHANGDITPCLSNQVCGNFFKGTLDPPPVEVCSRTCPSIVAYPFRTDNQFPYRRHLVEYVNRNREYRKSLEKHPGAVSFVMETKNEEPKPRVSVVLPVYNQEGYLPRAVKSILTQTFTDFELIIVNDGSTDDSRSYLDSLNDPRIKVIHQENKRLPGALNAGFEASRGELLTWTSADNIAMPNFLETFVAALDAHPEAAFACSAFNLIDEKDQVVGVAENQNLHYYSLLSSNPGITSFMYRRVCMEEVGLYDTELEGAEDWDMWLRIMERFQPVYVPEVLYAYRTHKESMTSQMPEKIRKSARAAFDKALARMGEEVCLWDLYPSIELCKDQQAAKFHACFDFGSRLLSSPFDAAEEACSFLELAHSLVPESPQVASNLALAYARCGRWDEALQLADYIGKTVDPHLQTVSRTIEKARDCRRTEILGTLPVFSFNWQSVELLNLDREQRLVFTRETDNCSIGRADDSNRDIGSFNGRIMIVAPNDDVLRFAKALQEKGYQPIIFHPVARKDMSDYAIGREIQKGIDVRTINCLTSAPYQWSGDSNLENAFGKLLVEENVDLVHFIHAEGALSSLLIEKAKLAGLPTVLTLIDADFVGGNSNQYEVAIKANYAGRLGKSCDLITAASNDLLRQLQFVSWSAGLAVEQADLSQNNVNQWAVCYKELIGETVAPETDKVISVVIATYNRPDWLKVCLEGFCDQTLPQKNFEILVIDDNSDCDLSTVISEYSERLPLKYIRHETNRGLGAARNTGANAASGDFVAFFDDDDRPTRRLLAEHMRAHLDHPEDNAAVLGYTSWDPSLELAPLMYHVTEVGQQYLSYPSIKAGEELPWHCFWGGTASVKRKLLTECENFDEGTPVCEDLDLSFRLRHTGFKVFYNPKIISYILRPFDYKGFKERRISFGAASARILGKYLSPELAKHFAVAGAADKWNRIKPNLPEIEKNISWLEKSNLPALRAMVVKTGDGICSGEDLLHQLYYTVFEAYRLKGYIDEVAALHKSSSKAPRILVLDKCLPYFDRASGQLRLFHMLKSMRKLGCKVTFVSMIGTMEEQYTPVLESLGIEVHAWDPAALEAAGHTVEGAVPLDYKSLFGGRKYDFALIEYWDVAQYYMPLLRKYAPDTEVILDTIDIHFVREIREAELKNDEDLRITAEQKKRLELNTYRQADKLWVVTEQDALNIKDLVGNVPIEVVPNIHEPVEAGKRYEDTADLLFVGNFTHTPNVDAACYLIKEIMPLVLKEEPEIKTYIVGNNPPSEVQAMASDNIIVTGYVESLNKYLQSARISVSPLRYGAGMKGKVGEALSWGLPVVTTDIGAEGMGLIDGKDALIGNSAEEIAAGILRLYRDRKLWNRLSKNGRKKASAWSPETLDGLLETKFVENKSVRREKLTSIVILACNQLDYTKQCLKSIEKNTDLPYELVLVDNGSTDGTGEYFTDYRKSCKNRWCKDVKVVRHESNLGYAAGNNSGIAAASGDYVLVLNNDTAVTSGWLDVMIKVAEENTRVGIVGPMSNCISGMQLVKDVTYKEHDLTGLDKFAKEWGRQNKGRASATNRVVGFCALVSRSVIEEIGGLDPRFGLGNFEDDDFCLRSISVGFICAVAHDSFVHHFGSKTFTGEKIDRNELIYKNWEIFKDKWSLPSELKYGEEYDWSQLVAQPFDPALHYTPLDLNAGTAKPKLSLCMITRDEEGFIAGCLESVKGLADEVIVVDTGSTDKTTGIARSFSARVYRHNWTDDFATARNESLKHASGEWILVLDADERLDSDAQKIITDAMENPSNDAYELTFHNYTSDGPNAEVYVHRTCRLFKNSPNYRYEGSIHERIVPSIESTGGKIGKLEAIVHHYGYKQDVQAERGKPEKYVKLLLKEHAKDPKNIYCLYNLGAAYRAVGDHQNALHYLKMAINLMDPKTEPCTAGVFTLASHSLTALGKPEEACKVVKQAEKSGITNPELSYSKGNALVLLNRFEDAINEYQKAIKFGAGNDWIGDKAASSYKSEYGIAFAWYSLGKYEESVKWCEAVLKKQPDDAPTLELTARVYLELDRLSEAENIYQKLLQESASSSAYNGLGEVYAAQGRLADSISSFVKALEIDPSFSKAYFNTGDVLFVLGKYAEAADVYMKGLNCCPENAEAFFSLGNCYLELGVCEAAVMAYRQALKLDPNYEDVREALKEVEQGVSRAA